jgi:hypothetical protein
MLQGDRGERRLAGVVEYEHEVAADHRDAAVRPSYATYCAEPDEVTEAWPNASSALAIRYAGRLATSSVAF